MLLIKSVANAINNPQSGFTYIEVPPKHRVQFYRGVFGNPMVHITDLATSQGDSVILIGDTFLLDGRETLQTYREIENYPRNVIEGAWNNWFLGNQSYFDDSVPTSVFVRELIGFCEVIAETNIWDYTPVRTLDWMKYRTPITVTKNDLIWLSRYITDRNATYRFEIRIQSSLTINISSYVHDTGIDDRDVATPLEFNFNDVRRVTNVLRGNPWEILTLMDTKGWEECIDKDAYIATALTEINASCVQTAFLDATEDGEPAIHEGVQLTADGMTITGRSVELNNEIARTKEFIDIGGVSGDAAIGAVDALVKSYVDANKPQVETK